MSSHTIRFSVLLLSAGLLLCGCAKGNPAPAQTAVPAAQSAIPIATAAPAPTASSLSENRTIEASVTLENEWLSAVPNGMPLLYIRANGTLTASGLMLDHAAGSASAVRPAYEQAAILSEPGGKATLSACTLASSADGLPLIACIGGQVHLSDTMAIHAGNGAEALLARDGGSIHAARCDLAAVGSAAACLSAAAGGTVECTAGTRISAADGGTAIRLADGGTVTVTDGTVAGDLFLAGNGNTLQCENTQLTGNIRFDTAEDELTLRLLSGSRFVGTTDGDGAIGIRISLDTTSRWQLTGDAYVAALADEDATLSNIDSGGFSLYYNAESEENLWLGGKALALHGGGYLIPLI